MGNVIKVENVRVMWTNALLKPQKSKKFPNNPPTYNLVLKLDDARLKGAVDQAIRQAQTQAQAQGEAFTLPPSYVETAAGDIQLRVTAREESKPQLADEFGNEVHDPSKFYSGCVCNVWIDIYTSTSYGNKVSVGLTAVQFVADGEPLDGRPSRDELFGPIAGAPAPSAPATAPTQAVVSPSPATDFLS